MPIFGDAYIHLTPGGWQNKRKKKKKKSLSESLSSSNLDKKLLNAFSWEQLMILDPISTVQPETTSTLKPRMSYTSCACILIQARDQILFFIGNGKILTRRARATKH